MAEIGFVPVRGNANEIANTPREDGQFLYTTEHGTNNKIYADVLRDDGTVDRVTIAGQYLSTDGGDINGDLNIDGDLDIDGNLDVSGNIKFTSSVGTEISLKDIFKAVYPIGSIYTSTSSTNPSTMFGGSWVRFGKGRVIVGVDENDSDFNVAEKQSGQKSHTYTPSGTVSQPTFNGNQYSGSTGGHGLTINEMPSHNHTLDGNIVRAGMVLATHTINTDIGAGTDSVHYKDPDYVSTELTDSTGGGQAHSHTIQFTPSGTITRPTFDGSQSTQSHMQPSIAVYMWKRVS